MQGRSGRSIARAAAQWSAVAVVASSCGGKSTVDSPLASGGADADASATSATGAALGTAVIRDGDEPTHFEHSYAILSTTPGVVTLMLFITDRPRTCAEHLAGIDYVGAQDLYYALRWTQGPAPVTGTWHFTGASPPKNPTISSAFLEHTTCGQPAVPYGGLSYVNEVNYLTLTHASASRIAGDLIAQVGFNVVGWKGPSAMFLSGTFDTVPCVVTSLLPVDPNVSRATVPSVTCR